MNYKLPDINTSISKSDDERKNIYRKFFAEMRLNRLQYHVLLLEFFKGEYTKEEVVSSIKTNIGFVDKISSWIDALKENGNFEEFKETCNQEIKAMDTIIQTYEERMKKSSAI